ncbi:hypothetical protein B0H11DRAFT_2255835 [Mycena galericulata]|nr:hypothetical protein B0H11DRAFT_2255835 [Mycena galericulata]
MSCQRLAEEERIRAKEATTVAAAEAVKHEAEEKAIALRKAREAERAEAMEKARLAPFTQAHRPRTTGRWRARHALRPRLGHARVRGCGASVPLRVYPGLKMNFISPAFEFLSHHHPLFPPSTSDGSLRTSICAPLSVPPTRATRPCRPSPDAPRPPPLPHQQQQQQHYTSYEMPHGPMRTPPVGTCTPLRPAPMPHAHAHDELYDHPHAHPHYASPVVPYSRSMPYPFPGIILSAPMGSWVWVHTPDGEGEREREKYDSVEATGEAGGARVEGGRATPLPQAGTIWPEASAKSALGESQICTRNHAQLCRAPYCYSNQPPTPTGRRRVVHRPQSTRIKLVAASYGNRAACHAAAAAAHPYLNTIHGHLKAWSIALGHRHRASSNTLALCAAPRRRTPSPVPQDHPSRPQGVINHAVNTTAPPNRRRRASNTLAPCRARPCTPSESPRKRHPCRAPPPPDAPGCEHHRPAMCTLPRRAAAHPPSHLENTTNGARRRCRTPRGVNTAALHPAMPPTGCARITKRPHRHCPR